MINPIEPAGAAGAAGGGGLAPCRGPDWAPGALGQVLRLPERRPCRPARGLAAGHALSSYGFRINTHWTDGRHGFGEPACHAVEGAAGAASAKVRAAAVSSPGQERAVPDVPKTVRVPAVSTGAEAVLGRGIGLLAAIAMKKE